MPRETKTHLLGPDFKGDLQTISAPIMICVSQKIRGMLATIYDLGSHGLPRPGDEVDTGCLYADMTSSINVPKKMDVFGKRQTVRLHGIVESVKFMLEPVGGRSHTVVHLKPTDDR